MTGFSASADPASYPNTLYGFVIVDPYYSEYDSNYYGAPIGNHPDTHLAIGTWNSIYFTPYYDVKISNTFWTGQYVAVLRSADYSPQPTPAYDTRPQLYSDAAGLAPTMNAITIASDTTYSNPRAAAVAGISQNKLADDSRMSAALSSAPSTGEVTHVDSLGPNVPSYELVEIRAGGRSVALAMIIDHAAGFQFGGLELLQGAAGLPDSTSAIAAFARVGVAASHVTAVWDWSTESGSPFAPLWRATNQSGRQAYLAPDGSVRASIHLQDGR